MSKEIVQEFEKGFAEIKTSLGFSATLEELDNIFFLRDMAAYDGVAYRLDRQICRRIVDTFFSWNSFLHRLVMPNPHSMFESAEAGYFAESDHKEMLDTMSEVVAHCTTNNVIGIEADTKAQAKFIDDSLTLWRKLQPYYAKISKTVHENWREKNATHQ